MRVNHPARKPCLAGSAPGMRAMIFPPGWITSNRCTRWEWGRRKSREVLAPLQVRITVIWVSTFTGSLSPKHDRPLNTGLSGTQWVHRLDLVNQETLRDTMGNADTLGLGDCGKGGLRVKRGARSGSSLCQQFVSGVAQGFECFLQEGLLDQHIVGVVGGDREDGDGVRGERRDE